MAETAGVAEVLGRARARTRPYAAVLGSRLRSQRAYRTSFALDLFSSFLVGFVELGEVVVIFSNVTSLGDLDLGRILLVFGLADVSYCLADMVFGHCDSLTTFLRAGTLDVFYLRPQPLLLQLVTSDISLRRLARASVGVLSLGLGLGLGDVDVSFRVVAVLLLGAVSGLVTFAAMFVWAAGAQFFLLDGAEATNAFVYGGRYASTQPASVWNRPLKVLFGFLFPMAFTAYLPVVTALGLPGSALLPSWVGWLSRWRRRSPRRWRCCRGASACGTTREAADEHGVGGSTGRDDRGDRRPRARLQGQGGDVATHRPPRSTTSPSGSGAGESVGYIGANGAGKSTTIKMLTGILVPTRGTARTCGLRPVPDRRRLAREVGVVFGQRTQLWWDLPTRESFRLLAAIHSLPTSAERERTEELVERLELGEFLATPVRQLSLGQRMRAEVAAALLHSPRLVILDEPTIGLDVLSKQRLREFLLAERAAHGTTLLLTTHDMGDVERLCDRVLLVDRGHLVWDGTLTGLSRTVGARRVLVVDLAAPTADLLDVEHTEHLGSEGSGLRQRLAFDPEQTTAAKVLAAVSARAEVLDLGVEEPDVEDVVRRVYAARR